MVELREVTRENLRAVLALSVAAEQRDLVAPNAVSISEAYFDPDAWFRAVYADGEPVGFVMLHDNVDEHWTYVWRMMIDAAHQRRGYGAQAMELVIERARAMTGVDTIHLSYADREGNAGPFYRRFGFRPTGEVDGDEISMALSLVDEV